MSDAKRRVKRLECDLRASGSARPCPTCGQYDGRPVKLTAVLPTAGPPNFPKWESCPRPRSAPTFCPTCGRQTSPTVIRCELPSAAPVE